MITVCSNRVANNRFGFTRRDFLRIGSLGLGGLTLPQLLSAQSGSGGVTGSKPYVRDKAIVLLFLHGGPSQLETWDPKPDAPSGIRSMFGTVATRLPGVHFGSHFPKMAALAHKLAVVRSFQSRNSGHTYEAISTAGNSAKASMSAIYARIAGGNHAVTGMPTNVHVLPEAVQPGIPLGSNFETGALGSVIQGGELGANYEAFNVAGYVSKGDPRESKNPATARGGAGNPARENMELHVEPGRFLDRRNLLRQLDSLRREADKSSAFQVMDRYQQQAFELITKGVGEAFDLTKEHRRTVERYDTSRLFRLEDVTRWNDMKRASNMLGHQLLMARRLCEAGCGFVTVSDCGWDMHSNSNSPKNLGGMHYLAPQVDHAVSAFLEDVEARGLSEKIVLVITGEMGRTPRINADGGRDHHGDLTPLVIAGGGLRMGQVVGLSDRRGERPASDAYGPEDLMATLFESVLDLGQMRLDPAIPREVASALQRGRVMRELVQG